MELQISFQKRGPEPNEFCNILTSKMNGFITNSATDLSESERKRVNATKTRAISVVKKRVCIRQNITDPTRVDGRRSANEYYVDRGILYDDYESPQESAERTSGRSGVTKFTKLTRSMYKAKEKAIRAYLDLFFEDSLIYDPHSSAEEYCNYIDHYTLKIIHLALNNRLTLANIEILSMMIDLCEYIVMGRIVLDWAEPNDLMTQRGLDNWRKHTCVQISFAAMLTALSMAFITFKESYAVATYGFCVGISPVVLATDFSHGHLCTSYTLHNMGMPYYFVHMLTRSFVCMQIIL